METNRFAREKEVALEAVRRAARLCSAVGQDIAGGVLSKEDRSPVTIADFGSQALVCETIDRAFRADPIIGEEDSAALKEPSSAPLLEKVHRFVTAQAGDVSAETVCGWIDRGGSSAYSERFWTVDPIDGTKGFLRLEQYAIALGLVIDGRVELAALGCPNLSVSGAAGPGAGALFFAVRGEGAYQTSLVEGGEEIRLAVSSESDPARLRFCESVEAAHSSHSDAARIAEHLGIQADSVRLDSQTKYAVVARGDAEAYLRLPKSESYREKIWDHAAGSLIVSEAGGKVTDIFGEPLDFSRGQTLEDNRGIVAANEALHAPLLGAIQTLGVGRF